MNTGIKTAIDKANEVRRQYNPDNLSPFPYEKVCSENDDLEITLLDFSEDLKDISGAILFNSARNSYSVLINKNKPERRQNFTIAHELGHYFLHKDYLKTEGSLVDLEGGLDGSRVLFRDDKVTDKREVETEANNFAASLIMPDDLVIEAWKKIDDIQECANIFNVSVSAMSIRLEKLGLLTEE